LSTKPGPIINLNPQSSILKFYLFRLLIAITTIAAAIASPLTARGDSSPEVRLLLDEKVPRVIVSGSSFMLERQDKKSWQPVVNRIRRAGFSPLRGGVQLDGTSVVSSLFRIKPLEGMLRYGGRPNRGYLTVLNNAGELIIISHIPLESYMVGVVKGEVDYSWPMDAVKAQVVAARSYALYQMNTDSLYYDLKTDITDQVYAGVDSEDDRAIEAVNMTRGQVLYKDGEPIQAFFHSSCGGSTASALEVWGVAQPAQDGVYCGECEDAPFANWDMPLVAEEIVRAIKILYPSVNRVRSMGIHRRTRDGRVQTLFVETGEGRVLIDAGEFRKIIGYRRLPSTKFSLGMSDGRVVLTGEGYGHGVGLCQWGAHGSALKGMDYREILKKYYVGVEIRRAY
jgi:stage II sporulation protein D